MNNIKTIYQMLIQILAPSLFNQKASSLHNFKKCSNCAKTIFIENGDLINDHIMALIYKKSLLYLKYDKPYGHTHCINFWHYYCDWKCEQELHQGIVYVSLINYINKIIFKNDEKLKIYDENNVIYKQCSTCFLHIEINCDNIIHIDFESMPKKSINGIISEWSKTTPFCINNICKCCSTCN
jgi:hypothetical protein